MKHNQSCKECKVRIEELLIKIYGEVKLNHSLKIPANVEDYIGSIFRKNLEKIYEKLEAHRGFKDFVRIKNYIAPVDFYVPDSKMIVEVDESQHFTTLRRIALSHYPDDLKLGFDRERWKDLCEKEDKHDNNPPFRDEQRAWYDTLRDFSPILLDINPTIRLYARDYIWCSLDSKKTLDQEEFKHLLGMN